MEVFIFIVRVLNTITMLGLPLSLILLVLSSVIDVFKKQFRWSKYALIFFVGIVILLIIQLLSTYLISGSIINDTSISTASQKVYKDTNSTLSFEYPQDWNVIEGPKQVSDEIYDYDYLKLTGKEGEITIMRANQLGGGCSVLYEKIKLKNLETDTCHEINDQGLENWKLYLNDTFGGGTLALYATVYKPTTTNRDTIIKILSSIDF